MSKQSPSFGKDPDDEVYYPQKMENNSIEKSTSGGKLNRPGEMLDIVKQFTSETPPCAGAYTRKFHFKDGDREVTFSETKLGWLNTLATFNMALIVGVSGVSLTIAGNSNASKAETPTPIQSLSSKETFVVEIEKFIKKSIDDLDLLSSKSESQPFSDNSHDAEEDNT